MLSPQYPPPALLNSNYPNNSWINSYKNFSTVFNYEEARKRGYQILGGEIPTNCTVNEKGGTFCLDLRIPEYIPPPIDQNWVKFQGSLKGALEVFRRHFLNSGVTSIQTPFRRQSLGLSQNGVQKTISYRHSLPSHNQQIKFLKNADENPNGISILDSKQYSEDFTSFGDPKYNSAIILFSNVKSLTGTHYYVTDEKAQIAPSIYVQVPGLCNIKGCHELQFSPYGSLENEAGVIPNKGIRKILHKVEKVREYKDYYLTSAITGDSLFQVATLAHYLTNKGELNADFVQSYLFNPVFEIHSCVNSLSLNLLKKPQNMTQEAFSNIKKSLTALANSEPLRNGSRLYAKEIKEMRCELYPVSKECKCVIL